MDNEEVLDPQLEKLKLRITFEDSMLDNEEEYDNLLKNLLEDSKNIALSLKYPFEDYSKITFPIYLENWQIRCCMELYENLGKEGIKSYSENGISFTKDSGAISERLANEIIPVIGVPKIVVETNEETTN